MEEINQNNCVGKRIGLYDVLYECNYKSNDGHRLFHIRCSECGWETDRALKDFKFNTAKCAHINANGEYHKYSNWKNHKLQHIFKGMKARCYNPNNKDYCRYGARNIKICDEWLNDPALFEHWSMNNGYQDGLSIDRVDSNEGYYPDNCRWVTAKNNSKYKSTTDVIDVDNEIHTGRDWAKVLGFGENLINKYARRHGIENTVEFIRRYRNNPSLIPKHKQSYYDLYMN